MNQTLLRATAVAATLIAASAVRAQEDSTNSTIPDVQAPPTVKLEPTEREMRNRIGVGYLMGLNMHVDFRRLGGLALSDPGPATGSAVNRNYDDGFNRVDISGNRGTVTWNWGYTQPQSIQGDNLVLQSYSSATVDSNDHENDPEHGFELFYQRELHREQHWRIGAEARFGYNRLSVSDSTPLLTPTGRVDDAYSLNGTVAPMAPYSGNFKGPADLISSIPSRSSASLPGAATVLGSRQLDADLFIFRLGPYLEFPLNDKWTVFADGGVSLGFARTGFSFSESVFIDDPQYDIHLKTTRFASGEETDFVVGGYVGGGISYAVTERFSLYGMAQFQAAGTVINHQAGKEAALRLDRSILVSVGISYSF